MNEYQRLIHLAMLVALESIAGFTEHDARKRIAIYNIKMQPFYG